MKTVTIRFEAVGRDKRTWSKRFMALPAGEAGEDMIAREARQALSTWDVCAVWDATGARGNIYAGSHHVGRFVRVSEEPTPQQEALWL